MEVGKFADVSLIPTADDAMSVSHEVQGIAGHIGYSDAQQLFGLVYVPHTDILPRAGSKYYRCSTSRETEKIRDVALQWM